ncbi:hypothetical protein ENSA5_46800 [Enhygromyxa salina]|uniref:DUF3108 domain-containing protein n=1 Tax=Enhygromyxa salina TaxID=215803 RepID=A0A2S9XIZ7_9BACT|nr:hypothetical protein [Enhygromyxa salina]PRP92848.1 hypothetical protein ENSA5_46800 [Enhygromyxa salina]
MTITKTLAGLLLTAPLLVAGCNQLSPETIDDEGAGEAADTSEAADTGETADTDETGGTVDELNSFYPLVDGGQWSYVSTNSMGQITGMDIVEATETTFAGEPAWDFVDNPNASGEWTRSTIARSGTVAARVHKEVMDANGTIMIVDYDPGFVRFDDAWDTVGSFEEILYDRTETDGDGLNPDYEPRGHSFEVIAVDQEVTVPAGTFNCVQIERVRTVGTTAGETVMFWYAPGIGKVREERPEDGEVEELVSVSIPGGAEYP